MADDDCGNGLGRGVVGVGAGEGLAETAVFHYAQGREYHRDAEGDDSEAADCGDEVVSAGGGVLELPAVEEGVEVGFLSGGEAETDVGLESGEYGVEVSVFFSPGGELVFERVVLRVGEDVVPDEPGVEAVKDEAAEEAVLRVGDEVENLAWGAGEDCGEAWGFDADIFAVFAADVGDVFVVECFAEAVGVVAVVGAECVGECVAFGLEHKSCAVVVAEYLVDGCGGGVGGDEEHTHRRFFGFFHIHFLFACGVVFGEAVFVVHHFGFVEVSEFVVDGFHKEAAEVEPSFAGGGSGGDEEEDVGVDCLAVVDAFYVRHTGGEDGE